MTSIILLPSDLRIHTSWQHTSPSGDGPHDENLRRTLYALDDSNTNLVLCEQRRLNQNRNVRNVIQHSIGCRKSVDASSVVVILVCQRDSKSRADCSDHILHEQVMSRADEFSLYRLAQCKFLTLRNESKNSRYIYIHISLLISDDDQSSIQSVHIQKSHHHWSRDEFDDNFSAHVSEHIWLLT